MDLPIRLVVGLGNPDAKYARTRHNAGQRVVEQLATRLGAPAFRVKYAGRFCDVSGPNGPLALLIPTTYMNLAGDSVGPAAGALRATPEQVLVIHDELDLPFGAVRGKRGGGHGGHNGLRSLNQRLGSAEYPRIRLGIDRPPPEFRGDQADWVLTAFPEPPDQVDAMITRGCDMALAAIIHGMDSAIATFHAGEPGARAQKRRERRERDEAADPSDGPNTPPPAPDPV
jgi:PTH1 family peptidyl-tRNA hydrolase